MTTKVVIHIGLHKTGTTFLQKEVFPKIPDINYQTKVDLTTTIEPDKINLFSDENLDGGSYRLFNTVQTRYNILENLHKLFPDAHIILCLRNKDKWLQSAYKQYILAYKSCSFNEYKKRLDPAFLDYKEYLTRIHQLFDHVHICYFEELRKNPQQFVHDMCDFIGVEPPTFENKIVYKSITDGQVKFLLLFDALFRSKMIHFALSILIRLIRKDPTVMNWLRREE